MATVTLTIDGKEVTVEQGTTILRAARSVGIEIPHYCYHPGVSVAGNCRICLVEIEKMPKLATSCSTACGNGMVVRTATDRVKEARRGVLELMLTNHPTDCPVCDKAGECRLQDYYMTIGGHKSRIKFPKEHKSKTVMFPPHIMFDAERCILCSRCVRFCKEVTKTDELVITYRGQKAEITTFEKGGKIDNGYAGNLHEICPVGALTSVDFRFRQRVWWLKSHPSVCPGCSTGCNMNICENKNIVYRLQSRENLLVNKYWLCDDGRYGFKDINAADRLGKPMFKGGKPASWDEVLSAVGKRLIAIKDQKKKIAGIASAGLTNEELFLFKTYMTDALGSDMVDFRIDDSHLKVEQQQDKLLRRLDKNPNTKGALAIGLVGAMDAVQILKAAAEGQVGALYITDAWKLEAAGHANLLKEARSRVEYIVMHSARQCSVLELADVVLPSTTYAEKNGTFTNYEGRVQKISRAIRPLKQSRPDLDIFASLLAAARSEFPAITGAAAAFDLLAARVKPFEGLKFETLPAEGALIAASEGRMAG